MTKHLGYSKSDTVANCDLDALEVLAANAAGNAAAALAAAAGVVGIIPSPPDSRTVATLQAYINNNAVFNVKDYGAAGDGVTDDSSAISLAATRAAAVAGQYGRVVFPRGVYAIAANVTVAANVILDFGGGGSLTVSLGHTVTINGPILAPLAQIFAGAGTYVLKDVDYVHVRWFGAKGDGLNDDTAAIQTAINVAIGSGLYCVVMLGPGTFKVTSGITFSTGQTPITLTGVPLGNISTGAAACTIKYTGVGGAVFQDNGQWSNYNGFAIRNFGSAANGIKFTNGVRNIIYDVSFSQQVVGTSAFGVSALDFSTEYSYIERCEFEVGGVGIYLRSGAATTVDIVRCIFDPGGVSTLNGIKADAINIKKLGISKSTFNFRAANSVGVDLSALLSSEVVLIDNCEFDGDAGYANAFMVKAANVQQLSFTRNACDHFGATGDSPILITNSRITLRDNEFFSFDHPVVRATDTASLVSARENFFSANVPKPMDEGGTTTSLHLIPVTVVGGVATLHGELSDAGGEAVFEISATVGTAFVINMAHPPDGAPATGFMTLGQKFTVLLKNASGGDITAGNPTFGADFQLVGPSFEAPPNGKFSAITFVWNGTKAVEIRRLPAASVIATVSGNETIPGYQHFTNGDATGGLLTLTLPDPRNVGDGVEYTVKKIDASVNHVRVAGGAANIDGGGNIDITTQNGTLVVVSRLSDVSYWVKASH